VAGMPRPSRVQLSVGASMARQVVASVFSVPMFVVAGVLIWLPSRLIFESVTETPINVWGSLVPHLFVAVFPLFGAYVAGAVGWMILGMIRYAGWLDGTLLG
jgi:hypothetical protein